MEEEEQEGGDGVEAGLRNLNIEKMGIEEEAAEQLEAALGMET